MNALAQYLWVLSPILTLWYFWKLPREKRGEFLAITSILLPLAFVLGLFAKQIWLNPTLLHPDENGFPSDHTLLVAALATLIILFNRKLSIWLWVIAVVVAISRVAVGEHHAIDVAGSIIIALASGYVAHAIIHKLWNKNKQTNF